MGALIGIVILGWVGYLMVTKFYVRLLPKSDKDRLRELQSKYPEYDIRGGYRDGIDVQLKDGGFRSNRINSRTFTEEEVEEIVEKALRKANQKRSDD